MYEKIIQDYAKKANISKVFARILHNRNITHEQLDLLLTSPLSLLKDPFLISGIEQVSIKILNEAMQNKVFYVYADYDVDGMTSGFIMTNFLREIGVKAFSYYPERKEGYGIHKDFADKLLEHHPNKDAVVITVDNGITKHDEIDYLTKNNIEVIVTDHHEPAETLPNCLCCDPWIDKTEGTHLCGAGVAWKICYTMEHMLNNTLARQLDITRKYIPYVGVGTVADVMPMTLENRALVAQTLKDINEQNPKYVMWNYFTHMKKMFSINTMTEKEIGWNFAPKLNACSRLGNTSLAAYSFYETDKEKLEDTLFEIAKMNKERKDLTDKAVEDALKQSDYKDDEVIFYHLDGYPFGIAGIVAGKLSEEFNKPAVVYGKEGRKRATMKASCRSNTFNIKDILQSQVELGMLNMAAGHAFACGAELITKKIPDLIKSTNKTVKEMIANGTLQISEQDIKIDSNIALEELTANILNEIYSIPYGNNEEPIIQVPKIIASTCTPFKNKNHLTLHMKDKNDKDRFAVAWNSSEKFNHIDFTKPINIIGTLSKASYSSRSLGISFNDPIIMIKDIKQV